MKPVIILTVYRRYYELNLAIERIKELSKEFSEKPDVVVVWARPEIGRLWMFQKLLNDNSITKLLTRIPTELELSCNSTTYPESLNIRLGLEWVQANYDNDKTYAIVQAADIYPKEIHRYGFIEERIKEGCNAVVFHWENGCIRENIWHTNFFAVKLNKDLWPPVSIIDDQDTLERQWGKHLVKVQFPNVFHSHNSRNKRFDHEHRTENQPEWPIIPQQGGMSSCLLISGYIPWWRKVLEFLRILSPYKRQN